MSCCSSGGTTQLKLKKIKSSQWLKCRRSLDCDDVVVKLSVFPQQRLQRTGSFKKYKVPWRSSESQNYSNKHTRVLSAVELTSKDDIVLARAVSRVRKLYLMVAGRDLGWVLVLVGSLYLKLKDCFFLGLSAPSLWKQQTKACFVFLASHVKKWEQTELLHVFFILHRCGVSAPDTSASHDKPRFTCIIWLWKQMAQMPSGPGHGRIICNFLVRRHSERHTNCSPLSVNIPSED